MANNKRPVTQTQDDHRKIDGIVAAIIAVGVMMEGAEPEQLIDLEWV